MGILDIFSEGNHENQVILIPVEKIRPSRYQPRLKFDEEKLEELTQSIQQNGLIQPLTVREMDTYYELIAGERRYRACRNAGFKQIPCYILSPTDDQAAQMALIENIQRQDLSAIEEAKSYLQIMKQAHLSQEQVAKKIGKSQSAIANKIRLLNLPDDIQDGVIDGKITERHARALLTVPETSQKKVYEEIINKGFNVRETESYIESLQKKKKTHARQKTKGYSKNIQIGINTINQSIKMIEKLGIQVTVEENESDNEVKMIVHFSKK